MSGHLSWYAAEVRPVGANISKYLGTILANELFELDYCLALVDVWKSVAMLSYQWWWTS
jgi:hypothetical protein